MTDQMIGEIDKEYWNSGFSIIGLDDAGRGPVAGSLFIGFVSLNDDPIISSLGLNDSKKLSEKKRNNLEPLIKEHSKFHFVGEISVNEINNSTNLNELVDASIAKWIIDLNIDFKVNKLFVDGQVPIKTLDRDIQICKPKFDSLSWNVAAASILAKNAQVRAMQELHINYPQYNFEKHNGYGTKEHFEAIKKHGVSEAHRIKWCRNLTGNT